MTRWPDATQLISQRFGALGESAAWHRSRTLLDLSTDDNVLEDLVQGMTGVKAAVGVRRAVVEEEGIVSRAVGGLPLVEVIGAFLDVFFVLGGERARPVSSDVSIRTDVWRKRFMFLRKSGLWQSQRGRPVLRHV